MIFLTRLSKKWIYWILLLGLSVSTALGVVGRTGTDFTDQLNHLFLDSFLKYSANGKTAQNSIVIDIDDVSLSAAGQWPWPRYRIASLLEKVAEAKPAAIGLDILFSEPDRTSLSNIQKMFKQDFGLNISFAGVPAGLSDNDGYLGQVFSLTGAVGARYFYFDHVSHAELPAQPEFFFSGKTDLIAPHDAPGVLNNIHEISSQSRFSGFLNNQPDSDGRLRRVPLLIRHKGVIYPHLTLAVFMRSLGVDSATIDEDGNGPVIRLGKYSIPIDKKGFALLNFNGGPHLYPAISAVEILNGSGRVADIKGKSVFIGSSAVALNDLHSTIFDSQFPGLKTQAVVIENITTGRLIREPSWGETIILLACIAMGLLESALFIRFREPAMLFLGTLGLVGVAFLVSLSLFRHAGIFLSPHAPILVSVALFMLFTTTRYVIEKRHAYLWFKRLSNARQVTMESMAAVAETRDPETGGHIKRTQLYVAAIAERLRESGDYAETMTPEFVELLSSSAPLHDIGKVGVPDHILLKQGGLTEEEYVLMKKHTDYGKNIIVSTAQKIEGDNFLRIAGEIASSHHEKWDGTGYPLGLAGTDIPLSGRIMAVADVYDALISRRCYKPSLSHEVAVGIMKEDRGKTFDPVVLDAFFSIEAKIREIAAKYQDDREIVLGDR